MYGPCGAVRRQVDEEGLSRLALLGPDIGDELHRFVEPDVRAIAFEFGPLVAHQKSVVEIVVAPIVRDLSQSSAAMPDAAIKSLVHRPRRCTVAEMPLAEDSRCVTVVGETGRRASSPVRAAKYDRTKFDMRPSEPHSVPSLGRREWACRTVKRENR